jgi:outer membrane lipase/esterase
LLATAPAEAASSPYTGLVVFGDSLSDTGNAGRFSNGPVWVEHVAERIGARLRPSREGGTNYAVGGARARGGPTDLRAQADAFLSARQGQLDPTTLYIVYGGGNDLLAAGYAGDGDAVARSAAAAIGGIVSDLAAAGAARILVPNLPDIGITPALRALGPAAAAEARELSLAYNEVLELALDKAEADHPVRVVRLDVFSLADGVIADPAGAGFRNVTEPCRDAGSCEGMLFWDHVHPTALAHARLAEAALAGVDAGGRLTEPGRSGQPAAAPAAAKEAPAGRSGARPGPSSARPRSPG